MGHVAPEAQVGGPIGMVKDGDIITIDAENLKITVDVDDEEMQRRREAWVMPPFKYTRGTMMRYIRTVASAQKGCVTDEGAAREREGEKKRHREMTYSIDSIPW